MPVGGSYTVGRSALELGGTQCGFLRSVSGGGIYAEVITEPVGPGGVARKHLGTPKYEEFSVQAGFSMAPAFYEWIAAAFTASGERRSGAILECDADLNVRTRWQFTEALITSITIPPCDAASKEPGYLTIRFAPESMRRTKGSGKVAGDVGRMQKPWISANFRLNIDGVDCARVKRVEALTVTRVAPPREVRGTPDRADVAGRVSFPDLAIAVSETSAESWLAWHEDFVVKGNNDSAREKSGTLELLASNVKDVLMRIDFAHVGVFKLAIESAEPGANQIRHVRAHLYCEDMKVQFGNPIA